MKKTYRIMVRKSSGRYGQRATVNYLLKPEDMDFVEFQTRKGAEAKIRNMQAAPGYLALDAKYRPVYEVV